MKLKQRINKILILLFMPALFAGVLFFCGFTRALPCGVIINGADVSGLSENAAVLCVRDKIERELKGKTLEVCADGHIYKFAYPEISYRDNLREVVKAVKRGGNYTAEISYYLCGFDEITRYICANERICAQDAAAIFSSEGKPFTYTSASVGRRVDEKKLRKDLRASLSGGFEKVTLSYLPEKYKYGLEEVKKRTVRLSSYTTYFDAENVNRSCNILLAAQAVNGTVISPDGVFSFNSTVGERSLERGYLPAKIIENGQFTEGVGGGVCQVSTTLYNAAVLAGMKVEEYHPHSLPVGYVPPSRDAMVSGTRCDLKFRNNSPYPVYIRAYAESNSVKFVFFGSKGEEEYSLSSVVTGSLPVPVEQTENPEEVRDGREGLTSECYLVIKRGEYVKRTLLRKDKYFPQKRVELSPEVHNETEEQTQTQNMEGNAQN